MKSLFLAVSLATAGIISASSVALAEPGVTDDEILVGSITDLTGPGALFGQEISKGARFYLKHVNDQGGVHGRKIRLIVEDDGYKPARSVATFRKLVDRDRVFCLAFNLGSSCNLAIFPSVERERVPLVAPACYNSAMHTPPRRYVFALDPSYTAQAWIAARYIKEMSGAENPRVAVFYQDDDYGLEGLKAVREACAHYGIPFVGKAGYKRAAVEFSAQVLSLKQANPTHVIVWTLVREAAAVLRKARELDWHPQFIGGNPTSDERIVELAGEAAEGLLAVTPADLWAEPPPPSLQLFREMKAQLDPEGTSRTLQLFGFLGARILVEGLQRAGRDLTREGLVEALETLKGWGDGLGPPITYGPGLRGGKHTGAYIARADLGRGIMSVFTDWIPYSNGNPEAGLAKED